LAVNAPAVPGVAYACNMPSWNFCQEYLIGNPSCGTSTSVQTVKSCLTSNVIGICASSNLFFRTFFYTGYGTTTALAACKAQPYGVWSGS